MQRKHLLLIVGSLAVVIIGVGLLLAALGPTINNTFSDVVSGLDADGGANNPSAQQPAQALASRPLPAATPPPQLESRAQFQVAGDAALAGAPPPPPPPPLPQQALALGAAQSQAAEVDTDALEAPTDEITPDDGFFEDYGVNPFEDASTDNLSTFSMDVDTASFTQARNSLLNYNQMPAPASVRPEEFINYFPGQYTPPTRDEFAIYLDAAPNPFGEDQVLLRVGLQGQSIPPEERDPALLIFVIDVSGSMGSPDRLELAKQALTLLVGELRGDDRVGIVVYSNETRPVLEPTPASEQERILSAINALRTEGSTNAEAGLRLGYQMATANMREDEITRVVLLSDGVANVGITGADGILGQIQSRVDQGVTLSTIGFGMGSFNDTLMEQLANDGDGNYYYVDTLREAERIFVHQLASTLQVIAYDAKVQVEFNPEVVSQYRLIGYENRAIADEDFRDDTVDAGEVGAGHSVTALYEVELLPDVSEGTLATAYIRYQDAGREYALETNASITLNDIAVSIDDTSEGFRLVAGAAGFAELLRNSPFAEDDLYSDVLRLVNPLAEMHEQAAELVQMVQVATRLQDQ